MNECSGTFYDGDGAQAHPAILQWADGADDVIVLVPDQGMEQRIERAALKVDAPLGAGSPRSVVFENGARFYTREGCLLNSLEPAGESKWRQPHYWASRLEQHQHAVLLSICLLVLFLFTGYRYGIPVVAKSLAYKLPYSTLETMSDNTAAVLDRFLGFEPSTLDAVEQERLRAHFERLVAEIGSSQYHYRLEFRSFGKNAFALPSGRIVVGDQLVEIMPDDEALVAVFAHEIAHVELRHGTRQVLQEAGVAFMIGAALGDISSGAGVFGALPQVMLSSGYSRNFETEADLFAANYLMESYGSTTAMANALETLAEVMEGAEVEALGWISSHPHTEDRIERVRAYGTD